MWNWFSRERITFKTMIYLYRTWILEWAIFEIIFLNTLYLGYLKWVSTFWAHTNQPLRPHDMITNQVIRQSKTSILHLLQKKKFSKPVSHAQRYPWEKFPTFAGWWLSKIHIKLILHSTRMRGKGLGGSVVHSLRMPYEYQLMSFRWCQKWWWQC